MKTCCILLLLAFMACRTETKDCKTLIVQTWGLKDHEVNQEEFKKKAFEGLNSDDIAAVNQTGSWQNIIDNFVTTNDTIEFTADGKYRHMESETSYSLSDDCKKLIFEMSPGQQSEYTVYKLTAGKLVLEYIGIKMEYGKMASK